jgi:SAM-dependent methyltransferase
VLKRLLASFAAPAPKPAALPAQRTPLKIELDAQRRRVLNVGGGSKTIGIPEHYRGWQHLLLDVDARGEVDVVLDARDLELLEPGQIDAVYCSHNLEHYYAHDVRRVLAGFAHVLKPEGFVEIRVPDIEAVARAMLERGMDIEDTLYVAPVGPITVRDVFYGYGREIEQSGQDFYAHKTGFTRTSLTRALEGAGFTTVRTLEPLGGYEVRVAATRALDGGLLQMLIASQGRDC